MGLFGKEPVANPCEAATFEEAASKNKIRLGFERRGAAELHGEMKSKGEPGLQGTDPTFWDGALAANEAAFLIYQEELSTMRRRVSEQLARIPHPPLTKEAEIGWREVLGNWANAIDLNDPSVIVYW